MANPKQIPDVIDALKGWPRDKPLDYRAKYASGVVAPTGSCLRLDSTGKFAIGVGTDPVMPLFATMLSSSEDVEDVNASDPAVDTRAYRPTIPTGFAGALVGCGGYELMVPTYTGTAEDFPPNTPLTSHKDGDGTLVPGTLYTDMIVGFVSRGVITNGHGSGNALAFWTFPVFPN